MVSYIMNTKNCMSVLLLSGRFDNFSFISGEITTYCTSRSTEPTTRNSIRTPKMKALSLTSAGNR